MPDDSVIIDEKMIQVILDEYPEPVLTANGLLRQVAPREGVALLPGTFNPLHSGHRRMAEMAAEILRTDVWYELSIENVDKRRLPPKRRCKDSVSSRKRTVFT